MEAFFIVKLKVPVQTLPQIPAVFVLVQENMFVFAVHHAGRGEAGIGGEMGAGVKYLLVARHEEGASSVAFACTYHRRLLTAGASSGDVKNLVAGGTPGVIGHLKGEQFIVEAKIGFGFGVVAAQGKLAYVFQVALLLVAQGSEVTPSPAACCSLETGWLHAAKMAAQKKKEEKDFSL